MRSSCKEAGGGHGRRRQWAGVRDALQRSTTVALPAQIARAWTEVRFSCV